MRKILSGQKIGFFSHMQKLFHNLYFFSLFLSWLLSDVMRVTLKPMEQILTI